MKKCFVSLVILGLFFTLQARELKLSDLPSSSFSTSWGTAQINHDINGKTLKIADQLFDHGVGVHAKSSISLRLDGKARKFQAVVGLSSHAKSSKSSVEFLVLADDQLLWRSGVMKGKDKGQKIELDLRGVKKLELKVTDADDGISFDHANWCEASIIYNGESPKVLDPMDAFILTPKAPKSARINGAKVFGVRPGKVFFFQVPATGKRPMKFSASQLPEGIKINAKTGLITGRIKSLQKKTYDVKLRARNSLGMTESKLRIVVGDEISLTPPMGWNSWYCQSESISQEAMEKMAQAFIDKGLVNHGWTYINMDDCWQSDRRSPNGAIKPNERFPDMKGMVDKIHGMGLKVGLYSVPWISSYAGFIGSSSDSANGDDSQDYLPENERRQKDQVYGRYPGVHRLKKDRVGKYWFGDKDALQWAEWGFDYIKYDWNPNDIPTTKRIVKDLLAVDCDIVLSLSNTAPYEETKKGLKDLANLWRTGGDIHNSWASVLHRFDSQLKWQRFSRPGHWNDPDMLQIGKSVVPNRFNKTFQSTKLTADEQYAHMTFWSLVSAPLLLSCDVESMTDFTLNLITNDEVIAVNQDPAGRGAIRLSKAHGLEVWAKELEDRSVAVGLFNRSENKARVTLKFSDLAFKGSVKVRDLWRQKDEGFFKQSYSAEVNSHGVKFILLKQ